MTEHLASRSLKLRLIVVMLATTLVGLLVALGTMIAYDLHAYHRGWTDDMVARADLLARTTAPALSFNDRRMAEENLHFLHLTKVRAAAIYTADGRLFASYSGDKGADPLPRLPGTEGVHIGGSRMTVFKRIVDNDDILGTIYLQSDYHLFEHLISYAGISGLVLASAMLVAYLVSVWLQRIVTAPILNIADVARAVVEERDYTQRAHKTSDDEVGMLVNAFNNMLSEIERRTGELEISNSDKAREVEERRQAQQEVTRLNQELERRVQERTLQLEASNSELALATQSAESANRAKSEFLSSMSHELRTPLNAIIGFGQLLTSSELSATDAQKRLFTEHIVKAGRHLLELINEILHLAQIEAGKLTLSLEPVELDDVLLDCQSMLEPMGEQRGIHLLFPPAHGLRVMADRMRLKQVLLNLLSNAIKYNRERGSVVVECSAQEGARVRIAVQDTGMGLDEAQLKQLFQPFHRLGQEAGTVEGTGIGLVVTKHLVELMNGRIGVQSTVGMGTVFWVDLPDAGTSATPAHTGPTPLGPDTQPPMPEDAHQAQGTQPVATVLYVEDNSASLKLVQEILSFRQDLRLLSAPDARLGIALARVHRPDVILMDNNLPGMSGGQALAVLKADPLTAHIPVIALTANAMPEAIEGGLRKGFFRYLTKPVEMQELTQAIDDALHTCGGPPS